MTRHRTSLLASTALSGPNGAAVLDLHTAVRIHEARAASSTRSNRVPKGPAPRRASWFDMRFKPRGSAYVNGDWREIAGQEGAGG